MPAPFSGQCGSVTFKQATVNNIFGGQVKDGSNNIVAADLLMQSSKGLYLQANNGGASDNIYLVGAAYSKTGVLGTTLDTDNLTISTASGAIFLNPKSQYVRSASALTIATDTGILTLNTASKAIVTDSTLNSSNTTATITSTGVDVFITSDSNTDVRLEAGLQGKVIIDSDLDLGTGNVTVPAGDLNLTSASGDINLQAGTGNKVNVLSDIFFATGQLSTGGGAGGGLGFSTTSGPITLAPATTLDITAKIVTTQGTIEADGVDLSLTTDGGDLVLNPAGVVQVLTQINTENGVFNGTSGLSLTTNAGPITIAPFAGQNFNLDAKLLTSNGGFQSTASSGMYLTADQSNLSLTSTNGNVAIAAGASSQVQLASDLFLGTGNLIAGGASGGLFTTTSGALTFSPTTTAVFTVPVHTTNGNLIADSVPLTLSTDTSGDIELEPAAGFKVKINAPLSTSDGHVESSVPFILTGASSISLNTDGVASLSTNAPIVTSEGTISATTTLTLESGTGPIALDPASGEAVSTSGKIVTTDGRLESTVAATISTNAGDLTLSPAGNLVVARPISTTDGHIVSTASVDLNLTSGTGTVVVNGNLQVTGSLDTINTSELLVNDKTITLSNGADTDVLADESGIIIDGTAGSKALSLLWTNAASSLNARWAFAGGDLSFQRVTASSGTVRFVLSISDDGHLQVLKQVDAQSTGSFADFEYVADFST
jgi:hypothetical protein